MNDVVLLSAELSDCERVIEQFQLSFQRAGQALLDIRSRELWRETDFESFEDYCVQRWGLKKSRAYQLCDAGRFIRELSHSTMVENDSELPTSERHIRPLMKIKGKDEDHSWQRRIEAWEIVQDEARNNGAEITEDFVMSVVRRRYLGGDVVRPDKPVTLGTYTSAFNVIHASGYTPEEAIERFGEPGDWAGFYDALKWMEIASELDASGSD
jgi:hypothetical protein